MEDHPFYWVPPGGESILAVSNRFGELVDDLANTNNVTNCDPPPDVLWAAHVPLDKLALDKIEDVNVRFYTIMVRLSTIQTSIQLQELSKVWNYMETFC